MKIERKPPEQDTRSDWAKAADQDALTPEERAMYEQKALERELNEDPFDNGDRGY